MDLIKYNSDDLLLQAAFRLIFSYYTNKTRALDETGNFIYPNPSKDKIGWFLYSVEDKSYSIQKNPLSYDIFGALIDNNNFLDSKYVNALSRIRSSLKQPKNKLTKYKSLIDFNNKCKSKLDAYKLLMLVFKEKG